MAEARNEAYKEGQGSLTRLTVWVLMVVTAFLACVELYSWIQSPNDEPFLVNLELTRTLPFLGVPLSWKLMVCAGLFALMMWGAKRYMTKPKTVDALVEVEQEMKKVSWPTRDESMNATWVVILVTLVITFSLFFFDIILNRFFGLIF